MPALMTQSLARKIAILLLFALFVGTLMPGSWKSAALDPLSGPIDLAALAHLTLFVAIAFVMPLAGWWNVRPWHVLGVGLCLALLTEGLQFFAVERHPNLAGVVQDVTGTLLGWFLSSRLRVQLRPGVSTQR
jgi:hypothetical protein